MQVDTSSVGSSVAHVNDVDTERQYTYTMADLRFRKRNVRVFEVSPAFLMAIMTGKDGEVFSLKLLSQGIPEDAEFISANYDFDQNMFKVLVAHADFPVVEDGCSTEQFKVFYQRTPSDTFLELL